MEQHPRFVAQMQYGLVYCLKKSLHDLKQSPKNMLW